MQTRRQTATCTSPVCMLSGATHERLPPRPACRGWDASPLQLELRTSDVVLLAHTAPCSDGFLFSPAEAPSPAWRLDASAIRLGVQLRAGPQAWQLLQPSVAHIEARVLRGALTATVEVPIVALHISTAAALGEHSTTHTQTELILLRTPVRRVRLAVRAHAQYRASTFARMCMLLSSWIA